MERSASSTFVLLLSLLGQNDKEKNCYTPLLYMIETRNQLLSLSEGWIFVESDLVRFGNLIFMHDWSLREGCIPKKTENIWWCNFCLDQFMALSIFSLLCYQFCSKKVTGNMMVCDEIERSIIKQNHYAYEHESKCTFYREFSHAITFFKMKRFLSCSWHWKEFEDFLISTKTQFQFFLHPVWLQLRLFENRFGPPPPLCWHLI